MKGGFDYTFLTQNISALGGQVYYFTFDLNLTVSDSGVGGYAACDVDALTDEAALYYSSYYSSYTSSIYASGILTSTMSSLAFSIVCSGNSDVNVTIDNVAFYVYPNSSGTDPVYPVPTEVLLNNDFSSGLTPWIMQSAGGDANFSIINEQAVFSWVNMTGDDINDQTMLLLQNFQQNLEATQTFNISADIQVTIPDDGGTECSLAMGLAEQDTTAWSADTTVATSYSVSANGTVDTDTSTLHLYVACAGDNTNATVSIDNVYLWVNVPVSARQEAAV